MEKHGVLGDRKSGDSASSVGSDKSHVTAVPVMPTKLFELGVQASHGVELTVR